MASMFDVQRPTPRRVTDPAMDSQGPVIPPTAARPIRRTLGSPETSSAGNGASPGIAERPQSLPAMPTIQAPPVRRVLDSATPGYAERPQLSPSTSVLAASQGRPPSDPWKPTLNSGVGEHGEPVYDAASIDRMAARPTNNRPLSSPALPIAAKPQPVAQPSLVQGTTPRVASTFGQPIMAMEDDATGTRLARRPDASLAAPEAMAEHYNSSEDRQARAKQLSDLDSQRFRLEMIASNPGRRGRAALDALSQNSQQQAALVSGAERLSTEAVQGRQQREAVLATTGLEQAGQDRRAQFGVEANATNAAADRAQQLGIASMNNATERTKLSRGETITAADGRVFQLGADGNATAVMDADGKPLRMPVARDAGALSVKDQLDSVGGELKAATEQLTAMQGINGTSTPEQVQAQQAYVAKLQGDLTSLRGGAQGSTGGGNGQRTKPSWEQFQARAKAQGSRLTPDQLKSHYDQM